MFALMRCCALIARWLAAGALCLVLLGASASLASERPNIIIILSDDVGFSDIGCYGGEISTPHLDGLAEGGLRFTQFYNAGRCCSTRASLLTGLYPHQAGMGWMTTYSGPPAYAGDLNRECVTLAEVLRPAGYSTYMAGKWHLTPPPTAEQAQAERATSEETDADGEKARDAIARHNWPLERGFDKFYGTILGACSYFDPGTLVRNNELIAPGDPDSYHYTDAISDNTAQFVRDHNQEKPFFMYVAYTAPHWPLHAKPDDIAKYKGKYDEGWDAIRDARLTRMKEMGLLPENTELAPNAKNWRDEERKEWQASRMEVYAAMLDSMDQGIGQLIKTLKDTGQYENTLVLYLSDNGGCQEEMRSNKARQQREKMEPTEPMAADALQMASVPEYTRAGEPVQWGRGVTPGPANTYMEVGREWANASNTPFRLFKHYVHEGGIATPLIAHWPDGIQRDGELESQPAHVVDIMPTLVQLAGAEYPAKFHEPESAIQPIEGVSLAPAFAGESIERSEPIFWEHEGNRAVRDGKWKLVARGATGKWQLYNLAKDRSELNDLAHEHPERVAELAGAWNAWAARAKVTPLTPYWPKEEAKNGKKPDAAARTRRLR